MLIDTRDRTRLLCVLLLVGSLQLASAESEYLGFRQEQTEHFTFIFEPRDRGAVDVLLPYAEEAFVELGRFLDYQPDNIPVVIRGRTDQANGYFTFGPKHISIFVASPTTQFLGARTESWLRAVFVHELAHFLHLAEPVGVFGKIGRVFGDLTTAWNLILLPGWMLEGITTNVETELTEGGRGRNPFFELLYKAPILEDEMFSYTQAGFPSAFPPSGRIYVAGYIMVDYLLRTYGADAFQEVYHQYVKWPLFPFGVRSGLKKVADRSQRAFYRDVVEELEARYQRFDEFSQGRLWSPEGIGHWYLPTPTEAGLFQYRSTTEAGPAVVLRAPDGSTHVILTGRLTDAHSYSVDESGRFLAATSLVHSTTHPSGPSFVSESVLSVVDRHSGDVRSFPGISGLYHPAMEPDGAHVVAVQRVGSHSRLVRVSIDDGAVAVLYEEPGVRVYNPAVSPDGSKVAFVRNESGRQDIALLEAERVSFVTGPDRAGEYFPRWRDAQRLLFSSDREGFLAVYETDLETGNTELRIRDRIGATAAIALDDSYLYQSYTSNGYVVRALPFEEAEETVDAGEPTSVGRAGVESSSESDATSSDEPTTVDGGDSPPVVDDGRRYLGLPVFHSWAPSVWLPTTWPESFGLIPIGVGAWAFAGNYIATQSVTAQAGYIPSLGQPYFDSSYNIDAGRTTYQLVATYSPEYDEPSTLFTTNLWMEAVAFPTLHERIDRSRHDWLVGRIGTGFGATRFSAAPHELTSISPFSVLERSLALRLGASMGRAARGLPPLGFYGGNEISARFSVDVGPPLLDVPQWRGLAISSLFAGLTTVRSQRATIQADIAGGYRVAPSGVFPYRGFADWEPESVDFARVRALLSAQYQVPIALLDIPFLGLGLTRIGTALFAQAGVSGGIPGAPLVELDDFLVAGIKLETRLMAGILPIPLGFGVALRIPYTRPIDPSRDVSYLLTVLSGELIVERGGRALTRVGPASTFQTPSWTSHTSFQ